MSRRKIKSKEHTPKPRGKHAANVDSAKKSVALRTLKQARQQLRTASTPLEQQELRGQKEAVTSMNMQKAGGVIDTDATLDESPLIASPSLLENAVAMFGSEESDAR